MCGFYPFFPLCFLSLSHLSFSFGVFGVIRNHPIISIPPPYSSVTSLHFSPGITSPPPHCITVWLCGWVSSPLYSPPPPPLPVLVKEQMRLDREEATRLLEEETEVRHSSTAGPQANSPVCVKKKKKRHLNHKHLRSAATGFFSHATYSWIFHK